MSNSIHDVRFFNFAVIDIIGTIICVLIVYHFCRKYKKHCSLWVLCLLALLFTIAIHLIFKVDTSLNYMLGLSNKPVRYRNNYKIFDIVETK